MKDEIFRSNAKLFEEAEEVKRIIRRNIHGNCRNNRGDGPAAKPRSSRPEPQVMTLHPSSR
ncbi:MAG: hypothetical protein R3E57_11615 [Porticoccaceae bacterium]